MTHVIYNTLYDEEGESSNMNVGLQGPQTVRCEILAVVDRTLVSLV